MNNKLALNKYSCGRANMEAQIYNQKCQCLPKKNRKQYKNILKAIYKAKREI